ncbi:MAG: Uma2 family endonuclease [Acidobacteria bacterium]|nr:Uma2 family endonuclease [Acidobacteriota bacterium]
MSAITAPLTVEQFLKLPEKETFRCELVNGEIVAMGNAWSLHELVKSNINQLLVLFAAPIGIGRVFSETMYQLRPSEARIPDVSFLLAHRVKPEDPHQLYQGAPDLAIEVVSSETASELEQKVNRYLETGSRTVWVVYPESRTVWIHRATGSQHLKEDQGLEEPDLLPGFRVAVSQIFEGI